MKSTPDGCLNTQEVLWREVLRYRPAKGHPSPKSPQLLVTYSAKHVQLCAKEIHELSVSVWLFYSFKLFHSVLLDSLQKRTVISNMCFFNAPRVKRLERWFALTNDVSRCASGQRNINSLSSICVYSGRAVTDLLALISIGSPAMRRVLRAENRRCLRVLWAETFMEVDTAWQRWRSLLRAVAFSGL